jgi:hypothetical protein
MGSGGYSSTILTDLEELAEGEDEQDDLDMYPWARQGEDSSPNPKGHLQKHHSISRNHPWTKLMDDDEVEIIPEKKPKVFSNIHFVRTRLFDTGRSSSTRKEWEVAEEKEQAMSEKDGVMKGGVQKPDPQDCKVPFEMAMQFEPPEEEIVFTREEQSNLPSNNDKCKAFIMNPPILEMSVRHRRTASGDISEISSLSGTKPHGIEYSLKTDFEDKSTFWRAVSEDIVRSRERKESRQQNKVEDYDTPPKCLILLMDPTKKIFEIVPMAYQPEATTVGEMLEKLPHAATDCRFSRISYTGLAYQGMHICAPMVPVDIILEAVSRGQPLFAVPENCSAGQIEIIGTYLLGTPKVARLLDDQLERLKAVSG